MCITAKDTVVGITEVVVALQVGEGFKHIGRETAEVEPHIVSVVTRAEYPRSGRFKLVFGKTVCCSLRVLLVVEEIIEVEVGIVDVDVAELIV